MLIKKAIVTEANNTHMEVLGLPLTMLIIMIEYSIFQFQATGCGESCNWPTVNEAGWDFIGPCACILNVETQEACPELWVVVY